MLASHQIAAQNEENKNEETEDPIRNQQQNSRPSVIQYAPGPSVSVELHARALPGNVVTHFKIDNAKLQLEEFLNNAKRLIGKQYSPKRITKIKLYQIWTIVRCDIY